MRPTDSTPSLVATLLAEVREARFCDGLRCPRCHCERVILWGGFSGRRRYRCTGCRRTFSDLTGTPAAFTKKLHLWPSYSRCLADACSVRRAARIVGVRPSTAFRWRHALLRGLRAQDSERLAGWIEVGWHAVIYSDKGRRNLQRTPRQRGLDGWQWLLWRRLVSIVVACDRHGHVVSELCERSRPTIDDFREALASRVPSRPTVIAQHGRAGPAAGFARLRRGAYHDARAASGGSQALLIHTLTLRAYLARYEDWMRRFRGVATKYLPNYLVWHRAVDRTYRLGVAGSSLRWPVHSGFL
jgi:transposase-like protein